MAEHHQLWNISVHFTNVTKENEPLEFDCHDLCGNISTGFLGIIIRYNSEPAQLEVILIVHLEIFTSHFFVLKKFFKNNLFRVVQLKEIRLLWAIKRRCFGRPLMSLPANTETLQLQCQR